MNGHHTPMQTPTSMTILMPKNKKKGPKDVVNISWATGESFFLPVLFLY